MPDSKSEDGMIIIITMIIIIIIIIATTMMIVIIAITMMTIIKTKIKLLPRCLTASQKKAQGAAQGESNKNSLLRWISHHHHHH